MEWTRRPAVRAAATAASAYLVVAHLQERGTWFWVGLGLLVLNLAGILAHARRRRAGAGGSARSAAPAGAAPGSAPTPTASTGSADRLLADLLEQPEVTAAFADGPATWRQVAYLEDEGLPPVPWRYVAEHAWVIRDHDWHLGLDDELKPYLDLDVDPEHDPALHVLLAHPAVAEAWHEDREVYTVRTRSPLEVADFAALAARALVAHHRAAAAPLA